MAFTLCSDNPKENLRKDMSIWGEIHQRSHWIPKWFFCLLKFWRCIVQWYASQITVIFQARILESLYMEYFCLLVKFLTYWIYMYLASSAFFNKKRKCVKMGAYWTNVWYEMKGLAYCKYSQMWDEWMSFTFYQFYYNCTVLGCARNFTTYILKMKNFWKFFNG